jgi:hypothetical protein
MVQPVEVMLSSPLRVVRTVLTGVLIAAALTACGNSASGSGFPAGQTVIYGDIADILQVGDGKTTYRSGCISQEDATRVTLARGQTFRFLSASPGYSVTDRKVLRMSRSGHDLIFTALNVGESFVTIPGPGGAGPDICYMADVVVAG